MKSAKKLLGMFLATGIMLAGTSMSAGAVSDIDGCWAKPAIESWLDRGLITGYADGSFRPGAPVTRAEFVAMVNHSLGKTEEAEISFSDAAPNDWCYAELRRAVASGYASGYSDGRFGINDRITREQAAAMLQKAAGLHPETTSAAAFTDEALISDWAKNAVYAAVKAGYFSGYPDGSFGAQNDLTRAEAVSLLDRASQPGMSALAAASSDIVVDTDGAVIRNQMINGDLIISESVGDGSVTIDNTIVAGDVIVRGGGANSIHLRDTTVEGDVIVSYPRVRVVVEGSTNVDTVRISTASALAGESFIGNIKRVIIEEKIGADPVRLEVPADQVLIRAEASVRLSADVEALIVEDGAEGSELSISSTAEVHEIEANAAVKIMGSGKIGTLEANANGITTTIRPVKTETADGVRAPSGTSSGSSSGSSGSSGSSSGSSSSSGGSSPSNPSNGLQIEDFVVVNSATLRVKLNLEPAAPQFTVRNLEDNTDLEIAHTQVEDDGYHWIWLSSNSLTANISLDWDGTYQLIVNSSNYPTLTHPFKGSEMLKYFNCPSTNVYSATTETGRDRLTVKLETPVGHEYTTSDLADITFSVTEDETEILRSAEIIDMADDTVTYALDLTKEIVGGQTYSILLQKRGFHDSRISYIPVESISLQFYPNDLRDEEPYPLAWSEDYSTYGFMTAEIYPANATHQEQEIDFILENPELFDVDRSETYFDKKIQLLYFFFYCGGKEGESAIQAVSPDGGISNEIDFKIVKKPVESIDFDINESTTHKNPTSIVLHDFDDWMTRDVAAFPFDAANREIIWTVADESIVAIETVDINDSSSHNGYVRIYFRPKSTGETTVTGTAADGSGASVTFSVEVYLPDTDSESGEDGEDIDNGNNPE